MSDIGSLFEILLNSDSVVTIIKHFRRDPRNLKYSAQILFSTSWLKTCSHQTIKINSIHVIQIIFNEQFQPTQSLYF